MADKPLTWNQIKNWWPIFGAIITITIYLVANFADIRANQKAIERKIDDLISLEEKNNKYFSDWKISIEDRVGKHSTAISLLNYKVGIR